MESEVDEDYGDEEDLDMDYDDEEDDGDEGKGMSIQDLEKMYKLDKKGNIVKKDDTTATFDLQKPSKKTKESKDVAPLKKQKMTFNDLQVKEIEGDDVYEAQKDRIRDKKA